LTGQDGSVPESHSPLDVAMDLLVYAPVGFALSAAEEIPKLAAKGRAQLGGQIAMAKVVGQFAVAQGRKELIRRFSPAAANSPAPAGPPGPVAPPADGDGLAPDTTFEELLAQAGPGPDRADGGSPPVVGARSDPTPTPAGEARPDPGALAIPGYDSLAASQVVQRLAGLAAEELAAVGAYESAHRARRTILTRVRQLQDR
jgi:hypothetical protein